MSSSRLVKRVLLVTVAVGLLAVLACGTSDVATPTAVPTPTAFAPLPTIAAPEAATTAATPTPHSVGDQPQYGGRIAKAEGSIRSYDNMHRAGYGIQLGMMGNLYSQLVRVPIDTRTGVEGDLAESWNVSADGTTYVFKLRDNVVDHEGNPMTADDIYWNMVRYVEQPQGIDVRRQQCIRLYVKKIFDDNGNVATEPGVEITAPLEITMRLIAPRAAFIPCMTGGFVGFHPDTYMKPIDESGEYRDFDPDEGELIGYGPFKVREAELENFVHLDRHDQFHFEGKPYLDGYSIFAIPDQTARMAAFRGGRIDTICTWVCLTKADADALEKELGDGVVIARLNTIGYRSLQLNTRSAPFGPGDDPKAKKLRQAVNLAIDRDKHNKLAFDGVGFLSFPYFIGWEWIRTVDEWRQLPGWPKTEDKAPEIAEAKSIMEELGYGPNNMLKTSILSRTAGLREDESVAGMLADIYIDVKIDIVDSATRSERLNNMDFIMFNDSVGAPFVDPDAYNANIFPLFEDGGRNRTGWQTDRWYELRDQQVVLQDQAKRAAILRQMADIIIEESMMVGTIRPGLLQPHRGNWRGYVPPVLDGSNFSYENLWLAGS